MDYKNYLKSFILFIGIILINTLLITFLYNKDILTIKTVKLLELLSLLISSIISGFYIGKKSKNKGYLSGLILGAILITTIILLNFIISKNISLINIIIYILIPVFTTTSSIIGINKRR